MATEQILILFDLLWFEHAVFNGKPLLQTHQRRVNTSSGEGIREPENQFPSYATHFSQVRSQSEYLLRSTNFSASEITQSTGSIPMNSKLQTVISGKVTEFLEKGEGKQVVGLPLRKKLAEGGRRKRISKSLSELEFEELKGFMDLGFVFSEEDKKSSLVSIIPGLQRLGRKGEENEKPEELKEKKLNEGMVISRPYLSEAWDALAIDKEMENRNLMKWKVPNLGITDMEMKHHLRNWAHTVASTVR